MLETYLRPIYQQCLVMPIANRIKDISADRVTLFACLTGIMVAPFLMLNLTSIALFFLLTSGFLDTLDGTIARISGKTTDLGTVYDIVSDRIVELAIIIGLFAVDPEQRGWLCLLMLGSCYICVTSFLVVGIFSPNNTQKSFYYSPGLIERAEAFIFFALMILFPSIFSWLAAIFIILVLLTSYLRLTEFIKQR
ncbi:MAG: CDP-alcohol phosphatidyltransferase family protein [Gammaproteobacteria bacterium]|jgi:phosphatidylglycerophosphate synthase|nr:CDP-alcohol phosphatidyltransferase family protein [Gammaproteobacteria bacterium]